MSEIHVAVIRKDGRKVIVNFEVQFTVNYLVPQVEPAPTKPTLGPLELDSSEALRRFLADLTFNQPNDSTVEAGLFDDDEVTFLRLLGFPGGTVPDPIDYNLDE
jgi:hypothetical protein